MKKAIPTALAILLGLALTAAAFTTPTAEQIEAAATDPATQLAGLLDDASPNQAAAVLAQVAERIAALDLPANERSARLAQAVQILFTHFPALQHEALAAALGDALAGIALPDGALAAIRTALGEVAGAGDAAGTLLQTFDQSFLTAGGTLPSAPNPEPPDNGEPPPPPPPPPPPSNPEPNDEEPPPPPPPPPGPDYPGQTII